MASENIEMFDNRIRYPIPLGRGSVITLITDFGDKDSYVGEVKGVIISGAPEARIVDITNNIPSGDILSASLVLERVLPYYPPGTIHLVIVDPTVGSERKSVVIHLGHHILVGPDNGFATLAIDMYGSYIAYQIENVKPPLGSVSKTFHGRDIFAPSCVHLARGGSISELGSKLDEVVLIDIPKPRVSNELIEGEVIYVDSFGNMITNIREEDLKGVERNSCRVLIGDREIEGIKDYYTQAEGGEMIVLVGSSGRIEVAFSKGLTEHSFNITGRMTVRVMKN